MNEELYEMYRHRLRPGAMLDLGPQLTMLRIDAFTLHKDGMLRFKTIRHSQVNTWRLEKRKSAVLLGAVQFIATSTMHETLSSGMLVLVGGKMQAIANSFEVGKPFRKDLDVRVFQNTTSKDFSWYPVKAHAPLSVIKSFPHAEEE